MDEATTAAAGRQLRSAVGWRDDRLEAIDQTVLPGRFTLLELRTVGEVVDALRRLAVRGAPAIGVAGAFGVVLGLDERRPATAAAARAALEQVAVELEAARPTAVNLGWAVRRVVAAAGAGRDPAEIRRLALEEATRVLSEDREACRRIAVHGRAELAGRRRLLTHCNAGRLATAGLGTALAVVYAKAEVGEPVEVLVSETRPLLQGARLTAWELVDAGIPVTLLADTAAGAAMAGGMVEAVLVGCDRVARNGDTANKIGTYALAVLARANGIPFYVVGPLSSFDAKVADGAAIVIEQRPPEEVRALRGAPVAPAGVQVWNPAFDVTPAELVTAFITDAGVLRPPFSESIERARR
ncbi:MAG TPA: S-methyl-5-thioribose-1-phosphate isomerase [Actinomycetes bacterium]|jgi:methylthioribose-1-phosphate isomerase|nr:S-methyl-5-thioribose-1-phosphate isomerase [Actinomycetes bacterium]